MAYFDTDPNHLIYHTTRVCDAWGEDATSCNTFDDDCDGTTDEACP